MIADLLALWMGMCAEGLTRIFALAIGFDITHNLLSHHHRLLGYLSVHIGIHVIEMGPVKTSKMKNGSAITL